MEISTLLSQYLSDSDNGKNKLIQLRQAITEVLNDEQDYASTAPEWKPVRLLMRDDKVGGGYYGDSNKPIHDLSQCMAYIKKQNEDISEQVNAGFILISSFEEGATLTLSNEVLLWEQDNQYYRWTGDLPKIVDANSTPDSTGGIGGGKWVLVGDGALRSQLAAKNGATMVVTTDGITVQESINNLNDSLNIVNDLISSSIVEYSLKNSKLLALAYQKFKTGQQVKIVCVGDSLTAGHDTVSVDKIPSNTENWATRAPVVYPEALQDMLQKITGVEHKTTNRGYSGATAKDHIETYSFWQTAPDADVAHIMLGINDASKLSFNEYITYMEKLIRRYINWGIGVVVHTATPQGYNSADNLAPKFTQALRAIANQYACPIFESETSVQYSLYDGVYSDGTHFNAHGYHKYGCAVAAFIIAGGWVMSPKMVNGEIHLQNGRGSEGIGYYAKSPQLGLSDSSFLTNRSTGIISNSNHVITYTFFSDVEFLEIYGVGNFCDLSVELSQKLEPTFDGDNRGDSATNRVTLKRISNRDIIESTFIDVSNYNLSHIGNYAKLGCLVGRGWKVIQVTSPRQLSSNRFFNGIVIKEKSMSMIKQSLDITSPIENCSLYYGESEYYIFKFPDVDSTSSNHLAPQMSLPGVVELPMPLSLMSYKSNPSIYIDSLRLEIEIYDQYGTYSSGVLIRNASSALKIIPTGGDNSLLPISGSVAEITKLVLNFPENTPLRYYTVLLKGIHRSGMSSAY